MSSDIVFWKDLNNCSLENALIIGVVSIMEQTVTFVKVATCLHDCNINASLNIVLNLIVARITRV